MPHHQRHHSIATVAALIMVVFIASFFTCSRAFVVDTSSSLLGGVHRYHHAAHRPSSFTGRTTTTTTTSSRLFFNIAKFFVTMEDPEAVLKVARKPHAVIMDVRSEEEIIANGFIKTTGKNPWLQVSCTPQDCPLLTVAAGNMIPDKNTPIVIYCASGMRAGKAKEILQNQGYTTVVNAGGYKDLDYLQKAMED